MKNGLKQSKIPDPQAKHKPKPIQQSPGSIDPGTIARNARADLASLSPGAVMQLQHTIGNRAVVKLLKSVQDGPIQQKPGASVTMRFNNVIQRVVVGNHVALWNDPITNELPGFLEDKGDWGGYNPEAKTLPLNEFNTTTFSDPNLKLLATHIDGGKLTFTDLEVKDSVLQEINDKLNWKVPAVKRANEGKPEEGKPFLDTGIEDSKIQSFGMTMGRTIQVAVPGFTNDEELKANVTQGAEHIKIGKSAEDADASELTLEREELTNVANLFVKSVVSEEAPDACEIEVKENDALVSRISPKIYKELKVKLRFWNVTFANEENMSVPGGTVGAIMPQIQAIWSGAGVTPELTDDGQKNVTITREKKGDADEIYKQLKTQESLMQAVAQSMEEKIVNIILLPSYTQNGLAFRLYKRGTAAYMGAGVDKTLTRSAINSGLEAPAIFVTVGLVEGPQGDIIGKRSSEDDAEFRNTSIALDVAHELGHFLSLSHPAQNVLPPKIREKVSTAAFHRLMHTQTQYPTEMMEGAVNLPTTPSGKAIHNSAEKEVLLHGGLLTEEEALEAREFLDKWKNNQLPQ